MSVGLPTRNRAAGLERAMASVLGQEWANLELVVCDNASTDATEEICRSAAAADERVRYVRRHQDIGAEANFHGALELARGELFMWLADDDWHGPDYISSCCRTLLDHPDHTLVAGTIRYFRDTDVAFSERPIQLVTASPARRVVDYYRTVTLNGVFYGAMRRADAVALPRPSGLGGDWLFVASLAYLGKVRTLDGVVLNRSLEGVSRDAKSLAASYGLPERAAANWHLTVARRARRDILEGPLYASLGRRRRALAGAAAAALVVTRFSWKVWLGRVLSRVGLFETARRLLERRRRGRA